MATATEPGNEIVTLPPQKRTSLIATMAEKYGLEPTAFKNAIKATIFDNKGTDEELCAFLIVANHYDLNPFTKEIYAFRKQDGGIMPIVPVDGWSKIINRNPAFDGMDFVDELTQDGEVRAITCRMYRNDRRHPIQCTEYLRECERNSMPWKQWPRRMLRHKAMIQAARYAFGLSGIHDPDEAERAASVIVDVPQRPQGKVGVSEVNKLLDSMTSQLTQEIHDIVDAEVQRDESQAEDVSTESIVGILASCKTRLDIDKAFADFSAEVESVPMEVEARYQELREALPDTKAAGGKQKSMLN